MSLYSSDLSWKNFITFFFSFLFMSPYTIYCIGSFTILSNYPPTRLFISLFSVHATHDYATILYCVTSLIIFNSFVFFQLSNLNPVPRSLYRSLIICFIPVIHNFCLNQRYNYNIFCIPHIILYDVFHIISDGVLFFQNSNGYGRF